MRKLFSLGVLALLLSVLSNPVVAAVEDCDILKGDGGTKGLYGMCIAYWNSVKDLDDSGLQSNSIAGGNRFLDRYNSIRERVGGPEMPGLSNSPQLQCACWSYLSYDEAQENAYEVEYLPFPGLFEILFFKDDLDVTLRGFAIGMADKSCTHNNFFDGSNFTLNVFAEGLTDAEFLTCQAELQVLSVLDGD